MPMTLSGNGTITGLSAGGLPDSSIVTADIANAAVTAAKLDGAQSGSAPIYAARAWVNFNGTGTVAIRASGNVTSITDNGTGDYTINFTTAMLDANYAFTIGYRGAANNDTDYTPTLYTGSDPTTSAIRFVTNNMSLGSLTDINTVFVAIFR